MDFPANVLSVGVGAQAIQFRGGVVGVLKEQNDLPAGMDGGQIVFQNFLEVVVDLAAQSVVVPAGVEENQRLVFQINLLDGFDGTFPLDGDLLNRLLAAGKQHR